MSSGEATKYEMVSKAVENILMSTVEKFMRMAKNAMMLQMISMVKERHCPKSVMTFVFCRLRNFSAESPNEFLLLTSLL